MWKGEEGRDVTDVFMEHISALLFAAKEEARVGPIGRIAKISKFRKDQRKHIRWLAVECHIRVSEIDFDKLYIGNIKALD